MFGLSVCSLLSDNAWLLVRLALCLVSPRLGRRPLEAGTVAGLAGARGLGAGWTIEFRLNMCLVLLLVILCMFYDMFCDMFSVALCGRAVLAARRLSGVHIYDVATWQHRGGTVRRHRVPQFSCSVHSLLYCSVVFFCSFVPVP